MADNNIVKLAPKGKKSTYKDLLLQHIDKLTEEEANTKTEVIIIAADTDLGIATSVLPASTLITVLGVMELVRVYLGEVYMTSMDG